jgi:glutamate carboxypeptidase
MIAAGRALAAAALLLATPGMAPTLDGLSLIGGNAHTDREFAVVDSMVPRFYLVTRMIMELGKGPKGP